MTRRPSCLGLFAGVLFACASPSAAQTGTPACGGTRTPEARSEEGVVVVTASRHEERLMNAPVTMTVIPAEAIDCSPSPNLTGLLRVVPGMHTTQTSARDVNIASRAATGTLVDSLLVLLDGRSIYQDFFGLVMWDFLPIDTSEIKQVEVIRGPASAVWGANAMTGVVNVISKTPRELAGSSATVRFGQHDRTRSGEPFDGGSLVTVNALHAAILDDRLAYKVSAGFLTEEPFLRPEGAVPGSSTAYPTFTNRGTRQHRLDARADYDFDDGRRKLVLAGGLTSTRGIIHTGLGPLDINTGVLKYGRVAFVRDRLAVQFFVNDLDGHAPFLVQSGTDGQPLQFDITNQAYNVDVSNTHLLGSHHLLAYGGNIRHNTFQISIAPGGHTRTEGGAYLQDQVVFSDRVRLFIGSRVDQFGLLDTPVFSPRTALIIQPGPRQSIRFSFNRAFQAPSFLNNFLDTAFLSTVNLGAAGTFRFPSAGFGNRDLEPERLTAFEAGYIVALGRITLDAAYYAHRIRDSVSFTQTAVYTAAKPPPGWPLPLETLDNLAAGGRGLPSEFSYQNFDRFTTRGIEVAADAELAPWVRGFANYSWLADPIPRGFDVSELNLPSNHKVNLGATYTRHRFFSSATASIMSGAFWQDVLDNRFHGWTKAYALVDAAAGVRSADGSMTVVIRAANLANSVSQQHVFGDLIRRTASAEVRFEF